MRNFFGNSEKICDISDKSNVRPNPPPQNETTPFRGLLQEWFLTKILDIFDMDIMPIPVVPLSININFTRTKVNNYLTICA